MLEADVAVIGAGIAGMTASVALAARGRKVVVVEQESALGGRARGEIDADTGLGHDRGAHVLLRSYTSMLRWLATLGASNEICWTGSQATHIVHESDGYALAPVRGLPGVTSMAPAFLRDPALSWLAKVASTGPMLRALLANEAHIRDADAVTGADYLRRFGISRAGRQRIWDALARSMLGCGIDDCSAGSLLRICRMLAQGDMEVGIATRDLSSLVSTAVVAQLRLRGGTIVTRDRVTDIVREHGRWKVAAGGRVVCAANAVIVATPPAAARALVGHLVRVPQVETVQYACVSLWLDRHAEGVPAVFTVIPRPPSLKRDHFSISRLARRASGHALLSANHAFRDEQFPSDADLVARTVDDLARVAGRPALPSIVRSQVIRIGAGSYVHRRGFEAMRPSQRTPAHGLFLAGDWTATGKPPSMESAAHSGWLAAEGVAGDSLR